MRSAPVHRMHLKGPWQYEWIDGPHDPERPDQSQSVHDSPLLTGSRVKMPTSWQSAFGQKSGCIRFSRRFQRPTNLDDNERVHIAFDGIGGYAVIAINNEEIGRLSDSDETNSFDITEKLKPSNELTVELTFSPDEQRATGGLYLPVAIEIHVVNARQNAT